MKVWSSSDGIVWFMVHGLHSGFFCFALHTASLYTLCTYQVLQYSSEALAVFHAKNKTGKRRKSIRPAQTTKNAIFLFNCTLCDAVCLPFPIVFPAPIPPSYPIASVNSTFNHLSGQALCLGGDLGLAVGDLDTELLGAGNNFYPLPRGDGVRDPEVGC